MEECIVILVNILIFHCTCVQWGRQKWTRPVLSYELLMNFEYKSTSAIYNSLWNIIITLISTRLRSELYVGQIICSIITLSKQLFTVSHVRMSIIMHKHHQGKGITYGSRISVVYVAAVFVSPSTTTYFVWHTYAAPYYDQAAQINCCSNIVVGISVSSYTPNSLMTTWGLYTKFAFISKRSSGPFLIPPALVLSCKVKTMYWLLLG